MSVFRPEPEGTLSQLVTDFPEIVAKSQQASSMKANPIAPTDAELTGILRQAS